MLLEGGVGKPHILLEPQRAQFRLEETGGKMDVDVFFPGAVFSSRETFKEAVAEELAEVRIEALPQSYPHCLDRSFHPKQIEICRHADDALSRRTTACASQQSVRIQNAAMWCMGGYVRMGLWLCRPATRCTPAAQDRLLLRL
jgi:hypothetical protein